MGLARRLLAFVVFIVVAAATPGLTLIVVSAIGGVDAIDATAGAFPAVFVVALLHVLVLGLPIAMVLDYLNQFRAVPTAIGGFVVGAVPFTLLGLLADRSGTSQWMKSGQTFLFFGLLGAVAAASAYFAYRMIAGPARSVERTDMGKGEA